nr:hypothetical protein [Calditrichia bacterium]
RVALSQKFGGDSTGNRSGQIRELHLKLGINQLLTNAEDHLHWAPNFHRPELDYYRTIAAWDPPAQSRTETGPYLIRTEREGPAPFHPEIRLSAVYRFLDGLPYFVFSSEMAFEEDLALDLLRNDEMTMDSMFTDLSFERPDGTVVTVPLAERYDLLKKAPIENESPWLCFFNRQQGFAFGSIRLQYDIRNRAGHPSPVFAPHTQIGEWLHGITYWNRRLVHDQLMVIPRGSRYREQNAYLVFRVGPDGSAEAIRAAARRLRQPLRIELSTP